MKTQIHIIPTLQNGGAETLLTRLIEEFSGKGIEQFVITSHANGSSEDKKSGTTSLMLVLAIK